MCFNEAAQQCNKNKTEQNPQECYPIVVNFAYFKYSLREGGGLGVRYPASLSQAPDGLKSEVIF